MSARTHGLTIGLLTSSEICARYGISRAGFKKWREHPDFPPSYKPDPLREDYRTRRVWDAEEVEGWRRRQRNRRSNRRNSAVLAYKRRAGKVGWLTEVAHAHSVGVNTLRRWVKAAGLPLPRDAE